jgi:ribonuclease P protein component
VVNQALPKERRITRQAEIDLCYRQGRRWSSKLLRVHVRDNGLAHPRLAVSVPGRLCNAVLRNRWKRLLREAFRLNQTAIGAGLDLVVIPNRPPEGLKRQDVERVLLDLVRRHRGAP